MSSPFSTLEEFNAAIDGPTEGAIYTFANSPAINTIALLVSVGIFLWFMVKTYTSAPHEKPSSMERSLNHLSSFIIIGLLSVLGVQQLQQPPTSEESHRIESHRIESHRMESHRMESRNRLANVAKRAPFALLGMMGLKSSSARKSSSGRSAKYRRLQSKRPRR